MHPSVALMLRNPRQRQAIERALASRGVHGDNRDRPYQRCRGRPPEGHGRRRDAQPPDGLLQFYGDDVGGPGTSDVGGPGNIGGGAGARADGEGAQRRRHVGGHSGGSGADHRGQGGIIETRPPPAITQPTVAPAARHPAAGPDPGHDRADDVRHRDDGSDGRALRQAAGVGSEALSDRHGADLLPDARAHAAADRRRSPPPPPPPPPDGGRGEMAGSAG